jgi:hypothetical protein
MSDIGVDQLLRSFVAAIVWDYVVVWNYGNDQLGAILFIIA